MYGFQGLLDDGEMSRLTRERDELKALLDKFERHMAEVGITFLGMCYLLGMIMSIFLEIMLIWQ